MQHQWMATVMVLGLAVYASGVIADAFPFEEIPPLFSSVRPDPPVGQPDRYLETSTVSLSSEALRESPQRILLNLPGREPEIASLQHWEPRQGYIQISDPDDPTGLNTITIPDPSARPEDFHWRWYGRSANFTVALTAGEGRIAGRVTGSTLRYVIEPRGQDRTLLGRVNSTVWQTHAGDREGQRSLPFPPASTTAAPESVPLLRLAAAQAKETTAARAQIDGFFWDTSCSGPMPAGTHVIDVLQLYTEGLLSRYGAR